MTDHSVTTIWTDYCSSTIKDHIPAIPRTLRLGENEIEANHNALQIKTGKKMASAPALLTLQFRNEPLPKVNELFIVTDWNGQAQCIVKTTKMRLKPFFSIESSHVEKHGEPEEGIEQWKKRHWKVYESQLQEYKRLPRESMIVVCHEFEKVF